MLFLFVGGVRVRRRLKRQQGGEISVPIQRSNLDLRKEIREKIANGHYNLGVPVLETASSKMVLTDEGKLEKKQYKLTARKYSMKDIRKKALINNKDFMRNKPDEEYNSMSLEEIKRRLNDLHELDGNSEATEQQLREQLKNLERKRHWMVWHDHSTIANSGFMLFLLRELYDPAVHLTNKEYKQNHGIQVDVQSKIEAPHLYMLGVSGSGDADQLMFVPTRRECLHELSETVVTSQGVHINDVMRLMNGDNPSVELEDGTQKGGHRGCVGCDGDMRNAHDYEYMAYRTYRSLEEKQNLVLSGKYGKDATNIYPFKSLKIEQLRKELRSRKIDCNGKKPELQERLTETLGGTVRLPALLFGNNNHTIHDLNLQNYEVLFFEPLHACLNHIATILQELPHHITDPDTLLVLKETLSITLNKEKLRATDYRKALLKVTMQLADQLQENERMLLLTFCEMQGIYYQADEHRSPRQVLRLYNVSWFHGRAVQSVLCPPQSVTLRKLCGTYYHGAVDHAPLISRLVCLRSVNAELFERYFERIEDITKKTWGKRLETLVPNAFLHIQAEDQLMMDKSTSAFKLQEKEISKLAKQLPPTTNTVVKKSVMVKHAREWQAHCSKIVDFLKPGEGKWWKWTEDGSVMFLDAPGEEDSRPEGPSLYHFRSHTIKDVTTKLSDMWTECCKDPASLPLYKLRDTEGNKYIYT